MQLTKVYTSSCQQGFEHVGYVFTSPSGDYRIVTLTEEADVRRAHFQEFVSSRGRLQSVPIKLNFDFGKEGESLRQLSQLKSKGWFTRVWWAIWNLNDQFFEAFK